MFFTWQNFASGFRATIKANKVLLSGNLLSHFSSGCLVSKSWPKLSSEWLNFSHQVTGNLPSERSKSNYCSVLLKITSLCPLFTVVSVVAKYTPPSVAWRRELVCCDNVECIAETCSYVYVETNY